MRPRPGLRLTAAELRRFLDAPGLPRERIVAHLLAYTACRLDEIRSLRWGDVDLECGTLMIHCKGDKYRGLDIHPRLAPELRRWRLRQDHLAERDARLRGARSLVVPLVMPFVSTWATRARRRGRLLGWKLR